MGLEKAIRKNDLAAPRLYVPAPSFRKLRSLHAVIHDLTAPRFYLLRISCFRLSYIEGCKRI